MFLLFRCCLGYSIWKVDADPLGALLSRAMVADKVELEVKQLTLAKIKSERVILDDLGVWMCLTVFAYCFFS